MKCLIRCLALLPILILTSCSAKKAAPSKPKISVNISPVTIKNIDNYIETVGHMEAYQIVSIQAQVEGYLEEVLFEEGADVKEGDLLYVIDQRPYIAALNKAQGTYSQYSAELKYAQDTVLRNSELVEQNYISQDAYEQLVSNMAATQGLVTQSLADLEEAKINLGFTTIYAPISARAGFTQVYKGDLISKSSSMLDLNQITPIYATFFLPGRHLPTIQEKQKASGLLNVKITLSEGLDTSFMGKLTFINNKIDLATGMIQLKATLPNHDKILWPNQYVKIKLILNPIENALLIPLSCVEKTPKGDIVYVVNDASEIEIKPVQPGQLQEDNMIHIKQGLKGNERVVTSGQLTLSPGATVSIKHPHNK